MKNHRNWAKTKQNITQKKGSIRKKKNIKTTISEDK